MYLVLKTSSPPPEKRYWHNPDPKTREKWNGHFETITAWFCSSHSFNKSNSLIFIFEEGIIVFIGSELKYLGPSLRSVASLVFKAYSLLLSLDDGRAESTPGIIAIKDGSTIKFPKPHYQLILDQPKNSIYNSSGTLFTFAHPSSKPYYAPGSSIAQGIVWVLQEVK